MTFSGDLTAARLAEKPEYIAHLTGAAQFLDQAGVFNNIKQLGESAPDFALTAPSGDTVVLSDLLTKGPVVISFFRGEWCPFCMVELRAILAAQPEMARRGATLLLISPEPPSPGLVEEVAAFGRDVQILRDPMLGVALSYGLVYLVPSDLRLYYMGIGFEIPRLSSLGSWLLPLPADLVIGRDGQIALAYADVDVTVRLDPSIILDALDRLRT